MSINLKKHIFSYGTNKKNYLWNDFLQEGAERREGFFVKANAEISASWNLCLAGKQLTEKQPKVNISDETSGT